MAKDTSGEIASSLPVRRWRDNLPMIQLKELFNVNHFIVSQANPHIAPFLRLKEIVRAYGGNFSAKQLLELGFPLGGLAKLFAQDWEGDVTAVMPATLAQVTAASNTQNYTEPISCGASKGCTREKLSAIKSDCGIELALAECITLLNHIRRLKRSAERAAASLGHRLASAVRFNASKSIPSWNCIAHVISEVASQMQRAGGGSTGKNFRSIDLNSWTRSGGPLMRTASANKFVDYREDEVKGVTVPPNIIIQMVSGDSYYRSSSRVTTPDRNPEIVDWDQRRGYHITITEGDLLQPERRSGHESDTYHSSSPSAAAECVQLEPLGKEMDSGSTSETEDEKVIP
ncbi:hypothetical protein MKW92_052761 [Papaver armeniacum]|nr:hypothetical protein MKW92_052761 [Papaver armeniacum]